MTACIDEKNKMEGGRCGKVVGATLAGVLAVGMVPAAAFADEAPETEGGDISLLDVTPEVVFGQGKLTGLVDQYGVSVDPENLTIVKGSDINLVPETVVTGDPENAEIDLTEVGHTVTVVDSEKVDGDLQPDTDSTKQTNANALDKLDEGDYYLAITITDADSVYNGGVLYVHFKVVAASLEGTKIFNSITDEEGAFTYNTKDQIPSIKFELNGEKLTEGTDYRVEYYNTLTDDTVNSIVDAGKYSARLTGLNDYNKSQVTIDFTVSALDLATANISIADTTVQPATVLADTAKKSAVLLDGEALPEHLVTASFAEGPAGSIIEATAPAKGTYSYKVTPWVDPDSKEATGNIVGERTLSFDYVGAVADSYKYGAEDFSDHATAANALEIDLSEDEEFKVKDIAVKNGASAVAAKNLVTTVTDAKGNAASLEDLNTPGLWIVTVEVDSARLDYTVGGKASMYVKVTAGDINADASLYFMYDGKVKATKIEAEYDGTNLLDKLEVVLKDANGKVLSEGSDYTVKITDWNGDEVTEVVNVDPKGRTYKIAVSSDTYNIVTPADATISLEVTPIKVDAVSLSDVIEYKFNGNTPDAVFIQYTGDVIVPAVEYKKGTVLPADTYVLSYEYSKTENGIYEPVDEMKAKGFYKVYVTQARGVYNYKLSGKLTATPDPVEVSDIKVFADVPNGEWFSDVVYQAAKLGYINGYSGTKMFGPNNSITRGDVACVLFNMSGNKPVEVDSDLYVDWIGHATEFSDVDSNMYYAQAIGWAAKAGVVNGYGDGTFAPEQNITREEFASMLANFAKAVGNFEVPAEDVLADFSDASAVSGWAKENVAWAVSKKVMGNGGFLAPSNVISRAEVAAMAVNYQPEKLDTIL